MSLWRRLLRLFRTKSETDEAKASSRKETLDIIRQLATELDEAHELYRTIVNNIPFGVAIHDGVRFRFINPAGARILGASAPLDIIGVPIERFVKPENLPLVRQRVKRQLRDFEVAELLKQRIVRLDGRDIDIAVMGAPVILRGSPHSQIIILTDLTIADFED